MLNFALLLLALAQDPAPTLVLRGGRIFDAENAQSRPLGQLWIAGDRILGEKPAATALPAGVKQLDAAGCTLLPGLFDLHVHISVPGSAMTGSSLLDPAENLRTHLAFGVMHVVDLHNMPSEVFPLRAQSLREPDLARLLAVGGAFTAPGGHGSQFGFETNTVTSPEQVAARFEALLPDHPDVIKAIVEHGSWGTLPAMPALDEKLLAEVGRRAHAAGLPLFVHVWTLDEAKSAVRAGADALAHGVYVGAVDDELIRMMKERGTGYIPTLAVVVGARRVAEGKSAYTAARVGDLLDPELAAALLDPASSSWVATWAEADDALFFRNLKRLFDAGIRVGTGTDAGNPLTPHGPGLLEEIMLYADAGIPPAQALRCATLESARLLRRERDFGSLSPGKVADVVVVRGDPTTELDALWRIEHVYKGGREVDRAPLAQLHQKKKLAGQAPALLLVPGDDVPETLDDFDDGDLASAWGGEWTPIDDRVAPGGKSSAKIEMIESGESGHLLVTGELADGFQYGAFAGVTIQWDPKAKRLVDASAKQELVLRVRGTPRQLSLSIDRAAVRDYNMFATSLTVTDEWQELRVPLASLRQIGFGRPVPTAWDDIKGITLQARTAPGAKEGFGKFELEIDSIAIE